MKCVAVESHIDCIDDNRYKRHTGKECCTRIKKVRSRCTKNEPTNKQMTSPWRCVSETGTKTAVWRVAAMKSHSFITYWIKFIAIIGYFKLESLTVSLLNNEMGKISVKQCFPIRECVRVQCAHSTSFSMSRMTPAYTFYVRNFMVINSLNIWMECTLHIKVHMNYYYSTFVKANVNTCFNRVYYILLLSLDASDETNGRVEEFLWYFNVFYFR